MFLCPVTSTKLRSAHARGVAIWYSPDNGGRLITLAAFNKVVGVEVGREIWIRAGLPTVTESWKKCPSCARAMKIAVAPQWTGGHEVDVCRGCHILWLDRVDFPAVPVPEDLLSPSGDTSLVAEVVQAQAAVLIAQDAKENATITGPGPDNILKTIPAFLGLPVEMDDERKSGTPWVTWLLALGMLLAHWAWVSGDSSFLGEWGYLPGDPGRHFGLTVLSWGFLHADWIHLLSNLYFFGVFADDVEIYYGRTRFMLLIITTLLVSALVQAYFQHHPDIPHVGVSGVLCALMVNYGLIYRRSRIAFLLPYMHGISQGAWVRVLGWIRVGAMWAVLGYVAKDLLYFMAFELSGATRVSHSGHLIGAAFGFVFWFMNGCPNWYYDSLPRGESTARDRLLPYR